MTSHLSLYYSLWSGLWAASCILVFVKVLPRYQRAKEATIKQFKQHMQETSSTERRRFYTIRVQRYLKEHTITYLIPLGFYTVFSAPILLIILETIFLMLGLE